MKKLLFISLFVASINCFSKTEAGLSKPFIGSGDTVKVILSIKHNDRNISEKLRGALALINGTNIVAYCDNHAVFMIFLDKNILRDQNDLMTEIKKVFSKAEELLSFKEGDFNGFLQYCSPSNTDDAANLKKLTTN